MKKVFLAIFVCLVTLTMVSSAFATEMWDWHLRGADEGLAAGALPPPGLYFINDFYWPGATNVYNSAGEAESGKKLSAYIDVPILLWNPGICQILGATYSAAIAQPFDATDARVIGTVGGQQWGAYNTVLIPFILSWEVPCNFHVAASFAIGLNDGTTSPGDSAAANPNSPFYNQYGAQLLDKNFGHGSSSVYAWSSNDAYSFTPTIGISWLYAGWNISAEFQYTFWTKDDDTSIQSGDEFTGDYTATYTCGKWTFGLGAESENQVYNDKGYVGTVYQKIPGSMARNFTAGPIIGYNFGPCSLLFTYNFAISTTSDPGFDWAMLRLVVPLGNPCDWYK